MIIDTIAGWLLLSAAIKAWQIILHWQPEASSKAQLLLEQKAEVLSMQGRLALVLFAMTLLLIIFGVSNLFAVLIPGAMCGTGVCQALPQGGTPLLLTRGVLVGGLLLWHELDRINRQHRRAPLNVYNARILLACAPLTAMAIASFYQTFANLDRQQIVDCCAVVYNRFASAEPARRTAAIDDVWWLSAYWVLSLLLMGLAYGLWRGQWRGANTRKMLAAATILWLPVAVICLIHIFAAYHYRVLHHHCPWCLFLADHHWVGFPLFGLIALVSTEGVFSYLLPQMVGPQHPLFEVALDRSRRAGARLLVALVVFIVISTGPALVWRLRLGVWIGG
jgi:hypothetical protein